MAMRRLLIVGSGITGCNLSFVISRMSRPGSLETIVWEKSSGVGGRMASRRSTNVPGSQVDLGAQYFSPSPSNYEEHKEWYEEMVTEKILVPMPCEVQEQREYPAGTKHFVAPAGTSSVPKHLLQKSGADVIFRRQVSRIDVEKIDDNSFKWCVSAQDGSKVSADMVVLTIPIPQVLMLKGNFAELIAKEVRTKLEKVQYSSRYALGLFYEPGTQMPDNWTMKFISNNPCVRFVSQDNKKRGRLEDPPSVILHTSVPFALQFLDANPSDINKKFIAEGKACLPELPEPSEIRFHKWRYSQVYSPYEGSPGCLSISKIPPLILCGDAFVHSNINGCLSSANATAKHLLQSMPDLAP